MTLSPLHHPPPPCPSLLPPSYYSGDDTQLLRTPGLAHRSEIKTAQRLKFWLNLCSNHMATESPIHDYVTRMDNIMRLRVVHFGTDDGSYYSLSSLQKSKFSIPKFKKSIASLKIKDSGLSMSALKNKMVLTTPCQLFTLLSART